MKLSTRGIEAIVPTGWLVHEVGSGQMGEDPTHAVFVVELAAVESLLESFLAEVSEAGSSFEDLLAVEGLSRLQNVHDGAHEFGPRGNFTGSGIG